MKWYEIDGQILSPDAFLDRLKAAVHSREHLNTFIKLINSGATVDIDGHRYKRCRRDYM